MKPLSINSKLVIVLGFFLCFSLLTACTEELNPRKSSIDLEVGAVVYTTELVETEADMALGLMYREKIADDEAMLFVYDFDQNLAFWMKNTLVDLSIAFIDSKGRIREILDMQAGSEKTVRSTHAVRYALEVAKGSFERRGVEVDDYVNVTVLR